MSNKEEGLNNTTVKENNIPTKEGELLEELIMSCSPKIRRTTIQTIIIPKKAFPEKVDIGNARKIMESPDDLQSNESTDESNTTDIPDEASTGSSNVMVSVKANEQHADSENNNSSTKETKPNEMKEDFVCQNYTNQTRAKWFFDKLPCTNIKSYEERKINNKISPLGTKGFEDMSLQSDTKQKKPKVKKLLTDLLTICYHKTGLQVYMHNINFPPFIQCTEV